MLSKVFDASFGFPCETLKSFTFSSVLTKNPSKQNAQKTQLISSLSLIQEIQNQMSILQATFFKKLDGTIFVY